jgi:hypothetical protein
MDGAEAAGSPARAAGATGEVMTTDVTADEVVTVRGAAWNAAREPPALAEGEEVSAAQAEAACGGQHAEQAGVIGDDSCGPLCPSAKSQQPALKTSSERFDFLRSDSAPDLGEALLAFFEFYGAAEAPLRGVMDPLAPQVEPLPAVHPGPCPHHTFSHADAPCPPCEHRIPYAATVRYAHAHSPHDPASPHSPLPSGEPWDQGAPIQ